MERYELATPRRYTTKDGEEKTAWTRIGTAFPNKAGDGFNLTFDALPAAQIDKNGKLVTFVSMRPPLEREKATQRTARPAAGGKDLDDDIPF